MTEDDISQALAAADKLKGLLDLAATFSPLMGPAGPAVTTVDMLANIVLAAAHKVHSANGGQSWLDSLAEVARHLDPTQPNSPTLSGGLGYPSSQDPSAQGSG